MKTIVFSLLLLGLVVAVHATPSTCAVNYTIQNNTSQTYNYDLTYVNDSYSGWGGGAYVVNCPAHSTVSGSYFTGTCADSAYPSQTWNCRELFNRVGGGPPGITVGSWVTSGSDTPVPYPYAITVYCIDDDTNLTSSAPPAYTNYSLTLYNYNVNSSVRATWYFNGSVYKTEVLAPGQSDTATSPAIEISPVQQQFSFTGGTVDINANVDGNSLGNLVFTNPAVSGGISGNGTNFTSSGGVTGGTNGFSVGSGSDVQNPSTGQILWSAPGSAASDATLKTGFTVNHDDAQNLLNGLSVLDGDLNKQTLAVTNSLGQIAIYERSNNDSAWQQIGLLQSITNLLGKTSAPQTNSASLTLTNYATESTLQGLVSALTNSPGSFDTNSLVAAFDAETNVDTGGTNLFDLTNNIGVDVGFSDSSNYYSAVALAASLSPENAAADSTFATFLAECSPVDIDESGWIAPNMTYTFSTSPTATGYSSSGYSYGPVTIDFNPMNYAGPNNDYPFAQLFAAAKNLFTWIIAMVYMFKIVDDANRVLDFMENARGTVVTSPTTKKTYS